MNPSFLAIEAVAFLLFGLCLWHAVRIGRARHESCEASWAPLAAIFGTFVFTFLLELYLGNPQLEGNIYSYPDDFLFDPVRVPMWIPMGWAFVVYVSMQTSNKLEPNWKIRPVLDGLLALNLDLTLDPIAAHKGWWTWKTVQFNMFQRAQLEAVEAKSGVTCIGDLKIHVLNPDKDVRAELQPIDHLPPKLDELEWIPADLVAYPCRPGFEPGHSDFFGIPLRNFFAWFFIVASFSFAFRWLRRVLARRGRRGLGWELVAAALAIVPAGVVVVAYKYASDWVPRLGIAAPIIFTLLWVGAMLLIFNRWFLYPRNLPLDRFLWLAPLGLHTFLFAELFVRKGFVVIPELTVFIPSVAIIGLFAFGWPYLDDIRKIAAARGCRSLFFPGGRR